MTDHPAERFDQALGLALVAIDGVAGRDWGVPAGTLDWSCWQTVDHLIDCVFSYALQLAGQATSGFLPFGELRALPEATPRGLIQGLRSVGTIFAAVLQQAPPDRTASDGVVTLGVADWAARGGYEVVLHTHDVLQGQAITFRPPDQVCTWLLECPTLWMIDRGRASGSTDPWTSLLLGSGRPAPA